MITSTPALSALVITLTIGPIPKNPKIAKINPRIPAEKLFTNISNPVLIFGWTALSNFFIRWAAIGPITIAPRNIGVPPKPFSVIVTVPTITPIVAIAATTPPRSSWTFLPAE